MFRDISKILCVDVEMTCWEFFIPENQVPEIIQIGYCWLDTNTLEIENKKAIYVKPVFSEVSDFCVNLTGITRKRAYGGMTYEAACKNLIRKAGSRRFAWAGWGNERQPFYADCERKQVEYPFNDQFLDISALASLFLGLPVNNGLDKTLADFGISFEGRRHDGADDAFNQARVLAEIIRKVRQ
jgi:inhibitor of KinA sporulation pathway (predicted exonuclease)